MRLRPVYAATTAVLFAAMGALSAMPASAATMDGHELLPLSIVPVTTPAKVNSTTVTMADPGDCPTGSVSVASISLPGGELTKSSWVSYGLTHNLGYSDRWLNAIFGGSQIPGGTLPGSPWSVYLMSYDASYSASISCWDPEITAVTPGTPVYLATVKKLSEAEAVAAGVAKGYYTIVPIVVSPAHPVNVAVTPAIHNLTVSWDAVTADPAVTGYKISVTAGGVPLARSPFTVAATDTSAVIRFLKANTQYEVTVVATNSAGDSLPSTSVTSTTLPRV
jgi:Fibronectin type III domain